MKKFLLVLFCVSGNLLWAQEWMTSLAFEDKDGAKDTLWVGLDQTATYGVDATFGEESVLVDEQTGTFRALFFDGINTFQKKQIVPTTQGWIETGALRILIPNDKLPVTVSWNKAAFNEPNKAYSLMTDWPLGGWFDAIGDGSPFKEYMNDTAFVVVPQDSQAEVYLAGTNQEPMRLIYVALGSAENVTAISNTSTDSKLDVFFNPIMNQLVVQSELSIAAIRIVDVAGRSFDSFQASNGVVDCHRLPLGVYVVAVTTQEGTMCGRFIKF